MQAATYPNNGVAALFWAHGRHWVDQTIGQGIDTV